MGQFKRKIRSNRPSSDSRRGNRTRASLSWANRPNSGSRSRWANRKGRSPRRQESNRGHRDKGGTRQKNETRDTQKHDGSGRVNFPEAASVLRCSKLRSKRHGSGSVNIAKCTEGVNFQHCGWDSCWKQRVGESTRTTMILRAPTDSMLNRFGHYMG